MMKPTTPTAAMPAIFRPRDARLAACWLVRSSSSAHDWQTVRSPLRSPEEVEILLPTLTLRVELTRTLRRAAAPGMSASHR